MRLKNTLMQGLLTAGLAVSAVTGQTAGTAATQTQTPAATTPETTRDRPGANDKMATDKDKMASDKMVSKSDEEFMMKAAQGSTAEIQMAQMAQQKASSQEVKDYARKIEQDHTAASSKLKAIATDRQVSLPSDVGPKHQEMAAKLGAMSGEDFDRAYVKAMIKDHKADVKAFSKASERSMDTDLKTFASTTLPTLKDHLQTAEQLNTSTRSRSSDTPSTKAPMDSTTGVKSGNTTTTDPVPSTPAPTPTPVPQP